MVGESRVLYSRLKALITVIGVEGVGKKVKDLQIFYLAKDPIRTGKKFTQSPNGVIKFQITFYKYVNN